MDPEEKRKDIELQILKIIQDRLQKGEMNADRASKIAKLVLQQLPKGISLGEIYKIAPKLDDQFNELSEAVLPILKEYEEKVENIVKEKVQALIKQGHFTEAAELVERVIDKDTTLVNKP